MTVRQQAELDRLPNVAIAGGTRAHRVHDALPVAGAVCLFLGMPACMLLRALRGRRFASAEATPQPGWARSE